MFSKAHFWPQHQDTRLTPRPTGPATSDRAAAQEELYERQETKHQPVGFACCPSGGTWAPTRREKDQPGERRNKSLAMSLPAGGCPGQSRRLPGSARRSPDRGSAHTFQRQSRGRLAQSLGNPESGPGGVPRAATNTPVGVEPPRPASAEAAAAVPPGRCPGLPAGSRPGPVRSQRGPPAAASTPAHWARPPGRPRPGAGGEPANCGPAGSGCGGAAVRARRAGCRRRAGNRGRRSPPAGKGPESTRISLRVPSARPGGRCSPPPRCWRWTMRKTTWRCSARYGSALRAGGGRAASPVLCPSGRRASRGGSTGRDGTGRESSAPGGDRGLCPPAPHTRCLPVPPGLRGGPGCPRARGCQGQRSAAPSVPGDFSGTKRGVAASDQQCES